LDYGFRRVEAGRAGILVEAVAEVAAAEEKPAARVIERREFPLGTDRLEREDGMLVGACGRGLAAGSTRSSEFSDTK